MMLPALIFLAFAFVITLILAILFYTKIEQATATATDADSSRRQYVTASEEQNGVVREMLAQQTGGSAATVVGQLLNENDRLKRIVRGDGEAQMGDILNAMKNENVSDGNLLAVIKRMRDTADSDQQTIEQWKQNYAQANEARAEAVERATQLEAEYKQAVNALKGELETLRTGFREYRSTVEQQAQGFQTQMRTLRSGHQDQTIEMESRVSQAQQVIDRQAARISQLVEQLGDRGRFGDVDPSTLPDGYVVSIMADQNLVYIDRGQHDHILRGMTFEVFDRNLGVVKDDFDQYRGKATVEVIDVQENSAKARIVRAPQGSEIMEGDIVANAVYDPEMVFKFYVFGQFDIDNTGQSTNTDRRRIENMVLDWGGRLASSREVGGAPAEITYDVDFLVLGNEPALPEEPGEDVFDPAVLLAYENAKRQFETYHQLAQEARELSIPILNENRFLTMIGYYNR
jgi:uncharacterized coiled-coil protein SlyX